MYSFYSQLSTEAYDLDKPIGHSFGDIEYYLERLQGVEGKILEPAVGTGRVMIPLLEAGLQMEGMDLSRDMLALCKRYCQEREVSTRLFEGSMDTMSVDTSYEAIVLPAGSFLLMKDRTVAMEALKKFYDHLQLGGRLILDLFLVTQFDKGYVDTRAWTTREDDLITLEEKLVDVDFLNQVVVSHNRYEKWQQQQLVATELERFELKWYGIEEFKMMLEAVGYEDISVSANYSYGVTPTRYDQPITFEAVKR